jgi:hypothetical protein
MNKISDTDPLETQEWREALACVLDFEGPVLPHFAWKPTKALSFRQRGCRECSDIALHDIGWRRIQRLSTQSAGEPNFSTVPKVPSLAQHPFSQLRTTSPIIRLCFSRHSGREKS